MLGAVASPSAAGAARHSPSEGGTLAGNLYAGVCLSCLKPLRRIMGLRRCAAWKGNACFQIRLWNLDLRNLAPSKAVMARVWATSLPSRWTSWSTWSARRLRWDRAKENPPPGDEEGTVELLLAEGLLKKTRENELKFTQRCFRRLFC